jgi:Intracellular proteinase inhibitor
VSQGPQAPLDFSISVPKSVRAGQPVPIALRLTNVSDKSVEAHFLGRTIAFDIVVTTSDGTIVWRRLGEGAGQSILQLRTLAPGETMEWRDNWIPKRVGRYRVQGVLPSDRPEPRRTDWVEIEVR